MLWIYNAVIQGTSQVVLNSVAGKKKKNYTQKRAEGSVEESRYLHICLYLLPASFCLDGEADTKKTDPSTFLLSSPFS